jgi:hypothetical protein
MKIALASVLPVEHQPTRPVVHHDHHHEAPRCIDRRPVYRLGHRTRLKVVQPGL